MRIYKLSGFYKTSAMLLVAVTLYSCTPDSGPGRKKMPEFTDDDGIEGSMPFDNHRNASGSGSFAFSPSNVNLMSGGNMQEFVSVALPNAANDQLAISLINSFKPLALPLLTSWAQQQRHGVVIDLSSHRGTEVHRTDYLLEKTGDFTIPLVIMWDQSSASRVAELKNMVVDVPSIKLSCTSGYDPANR